MRYIPFQSPPPDEEWKKKAEELIVRLKEAPDSDARNRIIDNYSAVWGELKKWLLELSHGKCWFSEAMDCFSHWDVEHYRPKKSARDQDGTEHEGYWWLAFDWRNLRICGNVGNRKKGTYFPLREDVGRCQPFGDLRCENPLLLDPANPDDPHLLFFNLEGRAIPAPFITDEWEKVRVEYSIERYRLDFPRLMDKRKAVWSECWYRIEVYRRDIELSQNEPGNVVAKEGAKKAAKRLRDLMREEGEFSAVARACVESSGDRRVMGLLR